jgi:hypothetical protein
MSFFESYNQYSNKKSELVLRRKEATELNYTNVCSAILQDQVNIYFTYLI